MARPLQARSIKTIEALYAAAETLIARQGLNSLTMDAVAAEAGVSKGGVLHHFRSREALIAGLVSRKVKTIREGAAAEEAALAHDPNRALLGMIRHCARQYGDEDGFPPALLVAATENSESLGQLRSLLAEKLGHIRAGSDRPEEATMLVFATLGLLLSRTLGFSTLTEGEARLVFDAIESAARGIDAGQRRDAPARKPC